MTKEKKNALLAKNAPAGKYTVSFRVVSADGHIVTDSFSYQVTPTSTAGPASSAAATTQKPRRWC